MVVLLPAVAVAAPVATTRAGASVPTGHVVTGNAVESRDGITIRSQIVGEHTRVERVKPDPRQLLVLDRPLELRAVEPGGRRAVLADPLPGGATPFRPAGRSSTTVVVADLVGRTSRAYEVPRNVEPEAFGVGYPVLYVIDHRPKRDPISYRVAALNLNTGVVRRVPGPFDQKIPLDDMTADARRQVPAPSGRQLYTLYVETARTGDEDNERAEYDETGGYGGGSDEAWTSAFVHVLDLTENWAYCVNLPVEFGLGAPSGSAIAVSSDGTRLFIADAHAHALAVLDATSLTRLSLSTRAPAFTGIPLPVDVSDADHIELAATVTGVTLTADGAIWAFDMSASTWVRH
jgi:hypothetical protein